MSDGISPEAVVAFADCVSLNVESASRLHEQEIEIKNGLIAALREEIAELRLRERLARERMEWLLGGPGRVPEDWHSFEDSEVKPSWLYDA